MNNKNYFEDIIFAQSTPAGTSAIAVIRVSGKNSWDLLKKIFIPVNIKTLFKSHKVYFGKIIFKNEIIDSCIVLTFKENKSFTGEESFEIQCHGNQNIISLIFKSLISYKARFAEPGEFSKRAFLNGKIDLTEAEAVMDLIQSSTEKSALIAQRQLSGCISSEINKIKNKLADFLAEIEVNIDYPEEELSFEINIWIENLTKIKNQFFDFLKDYDRGHYYRTGINVVILGNTNSGKSTLFNFLLNEDKAIVSDIHGTTRDFLDGIINVSGYGVRIYDTAGLRESNDPIEKEGTKRAINLSKNADVIIYIVSGEFGITLQDKKNLKNLTGKKIIFVINKMDLIDKKNIGKIAEDLIFFIDKNSINYEIIKMSALEKIGIDDFNKSFLKILNNEKINEENDPVITNSRHANLIKNALKNLQDSIEKLNNGLLDLCAFEIREALDRLGEITGEITTNDILDKIFSNFCVGK